MAATATEPKTKELIRPMPTNWWMQKPVYIRFMIREVTSFFIAGYCIFLLALLCAAMHDNAAGFASFYASLGSPVSLVLHLIVFVFAVYHSMTFFDLTPRVLVVFRGDEKVPESTISGAHYAMWAVVSLILIVIAWVV